VVTFTAVPAGNRNNNGTFNNIGNNGNWWSSSENNTNNAWNRNLNYNNSNVNRNNNNKNNGFSVRCLRDAGSTSTIPTVTTTTVSNITQTTATSGGDVTSDGGATVTVRGVCWSTSQNPTISDNFTSDGAGIGTFTSLITDLTPNTPYYVRAYATNTVGTGYGNEVSFTTSSSGSCGQPFTDVRDGKTYNTVLIGSQCWMSQNLNLGTKIQGTQEQTNNGTIEKYCDNNDEANCTIYGGLYQWNEMMQYVTTPGVKGICPTGWHIPTDGEWCTVTQFLDPSVNCGVPGWSGTNAGGKMKSTGTIQAGTGLWNAPNTGATNESGFTAVPAGRRYYDGTFNYVGGNGLWWSSSEGSTYDAWTRSLAYYGSNVFRGLSYEANGFSVRCLRDL
jgi:uncharacterized protein (TIGR02145 family)